jgi:hypothetical protein
VIRSAPLAAALLAVALLLPAPARAHFGNPPLIVVPLDHITAGHSFPLVGSDLGERAIVSLRIARGGRVVRLGTVTAGANGHFTTARTLPSTFPNGYAKLVAAGSAGAKAEAWILVGKRAESTPSSSSGEDWGKGWTLILLAVLLAGAAAAVAAARIRRRSRNASAR